MARLLRICDLEKLIPLAFFFLLLFICKLRRSQSRVNIYLYLDIFSSIVYLCFSK